MGHYLLGLGPSGERLHAPDPPHVAQHADPESVWDADEQVEALWNELWRAGWSVVSVREADGTRTLIIRRVATPYRLSEIERTIVMRAQDGTRLKTIAADLGQSMSTVNTHLRRALQKLGLRGRLDLSLILSGTHDRREK